MTQPLAFDESLPALLSVVRSVLGDSALDNTVVHREAAGRLAFFYDGELQADKANALDKALRARLGVYARPDRIVADRSAFGADDVLDEDNCQWMPYGDRRIRYVDRRIVGVDWLTGPTPGSTSPPRFVFASLKGGVGRTTALCVAAADLAAQGKNVLIVDLDLEAPGVGTLLVQPSNTPKYGAIDYLAESVLIEAAELSGLFRDMRAPSFLTTSSSGRVDVVPAMGSTASPENYLGKLARALLDAGPDGSTLALRTKLQRLLDGLLDEQPYDVVLIDARAGLAELAAGPILGLGATVLLFGTAQRQTIVDYRLLFAQLSTLVQPDAGSPWDNLRMVLAKAAPDEEQNRRFIGDLYALFQEYLYEEQEGFEGFNFAEDDKAGPHYPVLIGMNPLFANWDPAYRPTDLSQPFYEGSFRPFLDDLCERIEASK